MFAVTLTLFIAINLAISPFPLPYPFTQIPPQLIITGTQSISQTHFMQIIQGFFISVCTEMKGSHTKLLIGKFMELVNSFKAFLSTFLLQ